MGNNNTFTTNSRFTDYDSVVTALGELGKTCQRPITLYKNGYDGDDAYIIGNWSWNNNPVVANRVIMPIGPIDFTKVTTTPHAVIASVDSPTQVTLLAHNLTSGLCRIMDVSAGTEAYDNVPVTVVGNTATMANTAGLAAGDTVHRTGVSELSIGGATRAVQLGAGCVARFAAGHHVSGGAAVQRIFPYQPTSIKAFVSSYSALALNQFIGVGWWNTAIEHTLYGSAQGAVGNGRDTCLRNGALLAAALTDHAAPEYVWMGPYRPSDRSSIGGTSNSNGVAGIRGAPAGSPFAALYSNVAAVFSSLSA